MVGDRLVEWLFGYKRLMMSGSEAFVDLCATRVASERARGLALIYIKTPSI
jgi:hypothetical protein